MMQCWWPFHGKLLPLMTSIQCATLPPLHHLASRFAHIYPKPNKNGGARVVTRNGGVATRVHMMCDRRLTLCSPPLSCTSLCCRVPSLCLQPSLLKAKTTAAKIMRHGMTAPLAQVHMTGTFLTLTASRNSEKLYIVFGCGGGVASRSPRLGGCTCLCCTPSASCSVPCASFT